MSIRILHTADVHLDAPFRFLGQRGREQREQLRIAFRRIVELAATHDLLLVAGDLFHSNSVSQRTLEQAISDLGRAGVPAIVLPGTHDRIGPDCVYDRPDWRTAANVRVLTDGCADLPELDLAVRARAVPGDASGSPMAGLSRSGARWNVAMAHGSVLIPGRSSEDTACPIAPQDIDHSGMDYVALGHWHSWFEVGGRVNAVYPGAPEILKSDQKSGSVASVTLSDEGVTVERIDVGVRRCADETLPVDGLESAEALSSEIARLADPNLILRVALTGLANAGLVIDVEELSSSLSGSFFHLDVRDETHPRMDTEGLELDERTVLGRFVRSMREVLENAQDERIKRTAEDALQLGIALLQGRNVLR